MNSSPENSKAQESFNSFMEAFNHMPKVWYYGCLDAKADYHLFTQDNGVTVIDDGTITPWGNKIAYELLGYSSISYWEGKMHVSYKRGWTAIAWADFSMDTTFGGQSAFLINKVVPPNELMALATYQWTNIFTRPNFMTVFS